MKRTAEGCESLPDGECGAGDDSSQEHGSGDDLEDAEGVAGELEHLAGLAGCGGTVQWTRVGEWR